MTEEELRIESTQTVQWEYTSMIDRPIFVNGYITGSLPRENRIAILEKENADLKEEINKIAFARGKLEQENTDLQESYEELYNSMRIIKDQKNVLEQENADLRKVAEFQQSSNMNTHLENKKLKEGFAVGSMWNKHLNSQNKALEEERDRYRNMTFDQREQLIKARKIIKDLLAFVYIHGNFSGDIFDKAMEFIKDDEVEK